MKNKILFFLSALLLSIVGGNAFAYGLQLEPSSIAANVAPFGFTGVLFASSLLLKANGVLCTTFGAMTWDDPVDNAAGCEVLAYYAPTADIVTFPKLDTLTGELKGVITMVEGKSFLPFYGVSESVKVDSNLQGEKLTKSYKPTGSLTYPSWVKKTTDFGRIAKNGNFIWIFIDNNGERKVIGSKENPAMIDKLDYTTGDKGTSGTSLKLEVSQSVCNAPAGYYKGVIPISGGTLPSLVEPL